MFSMKNFVKSGFLKAIGHMADYQIILNAAGWADKGVLSENDLAEINTAIEKQYIVHIEPMEETTPSETESTTEEIPVVEEAPVEPTTADENTQNVETPSTETEII